jgi:hypothetical protein
MRVLIRQDKTTKFWKLRIGAFHAWYVSYDAAAMEAEKRWKRFYKESAAKSMLDCVSHNLLNVADQMFISKLQRTKCKGITVAQYGYLKGIYERQQREW